MAKDLIILILALFGITGFCISFTTKKGITYNIYIVSIVIAIIEMVYILKTY